MMRSHFLGALGVAALLAAAGCGGGPVATDTPVPTGTPRPTDTPRPTATRTPTPSDTPAPTATLTPRPTLATASTSVAGTPGTPVSLALRMNLQPGEVYEVRFQTEQLVTQSLQGQSFDTQQRIGYAYEYSVRSLDAAGNTWVDVVYTWVHLEQETILGSLFYDSDNPPAEIPPGAEGFAALVGSGFSMLLTPQGKALEIDGLEAMYAQMLAAMDFPDAATEEQFRQTIQQQFGEEAMKQQMNGASFEFPAGPIRVGESWTVTTEMAVVMPMVMESTYTLRSVDGTTATIDVRSQIRPNPDAEPVVFGGVEIEYSLSGEQEGQVQVDLASGMTNSAIGQNLSGEMTMVAEGQSMNIPITIHGVVEVQSTRATP